MSLFDVTTTNGYGDDRWDYYDLDSLIMTTDIRPISGGSGNEEEFRKVLRLSGTWLIKEIENVNVPLNSLTTDGNLDVRISGGPVVNINPGTDMEDFALMSQEIIPSQDQGWGVNEWRDSHISQTNSSIGTNGYQEIDWSAALDYPAHEVYQDGSATTYNNCASFETTANWNEYREAEDVDQFRTRITTVQFYDIDKVTAITGLHADLYRIPTLPSCGYNDGRESTITADAFEFPRPWILTEFSVVPLQQLGGTMARVKYQWELWTDWQNK